MSIRHSFEAAGLRARGLAVALTDEDSGLVVAGSPLSQRLRNVEGRGVQV